MRGPAGVFLLALTIAAAPVIAVAAQGSPRCGREDAGHKPPAVKGTGDRQGRGNGMSRVTRAAPAVSAPVQREWGPDEHVRPGSSLEHGFRQEIRLNSVTEYREIPDERLWFAGFGGARVDGGTAFFSWNSVTPAPLEIEVANDAGERFLECERLVKAGVRPGRALTITGQGVFESVPAGGTWLGSFRLTEIEACGLK